MADEKKNEQTEQEEQAEEKDPKAEAEEKAPEAEAPAEEEAPSEDTPDEGEEAPEEEPPVEEEAPAEEAPDEAEEAAAEGEEAPSAEAPAEEEGDWKARRRLERSRRSGAAGPQRSPEDRAAERTQRRSLAARRRSSYRKKRRGKTGPGEGTPPAERRSAGRKVRQGRVVSDKPDKTITVQIEVVRRHTHYEKIIRHSNTLHAHDERNEANQGDLVRVVETRPLSRTKRWRLVEILEKAK